MTIVTPEVLEAVSGYNEAEVRFHILDPTLRKLGYPGDKGVYLKPAGKLNYPYFFIGHKNKKTDLPLGFPDYQVGLKGRRGSFIVEAKAATIKLTEKDVEQAHSYAAHSQVGANYFVLCNGLELAVFETLSGGHSKPIVSIPVHELDKRFHELENVLSPVNLEKHCKVRYDTGLKLCEGLGSSIVIHSGIYEMADWAYRFLINDQDSTELFKNFAGPQIASLEQQFQTMQKEFELRVGEGLIAREPDGRIVGNVTFVGATKNNSANMKLLGIDKIAISTSSQFISVSPDDPTYLESNADFFVEKGTFLGPLFGEEVPIDANVKVDIFIAMWTFKDEHELKGNYSAFADYWFDMPAFGKLKMELNFSGRFALRLAV